MGRMSVIDASYLCIRATTFLHKLLVMKVEFLFSESLSCVM